MIFVVQLITAAFAALVLSGCGPDEAGTNAGQTGLEGADGAMETPAGPLRLIYEVRSLALTEEGDQIIAQGATRTGGWSDPRLVLEEQEGEEARYRFVAVQPAGLVTQAIEPIEARMDLSELPGGTRQVTVISERGTATLRLNDAAQ
jgi:hypothetical protein